MKAIVAAILLALGIFIGMLISLEVGRRIGARRLARDSEGARVGTGVIEGAVFALLGLLIAFTFSGAASRFEARRDLIIEEANAIRTAHLRLDLLPAAPQSALRDELARSNALQIEIWAEAVAATREQGAAPGAQMLLLPALNQMIDITNTRTLATEMHPPLAIFAMLSVLALASALFAGYAMAGSKSRGWLHTIGFAEVLALVVYIIVDLVEYPRLGMIRVDAFDQALRDVKASMK